MKFKNNILCLRQLAGSAGVCGWLLLLRPVLYLLLARRRDDAGQYAAVDFTALVFIIYAIICLAYSMSEQKSLVSQVGRKILGHTALLWFVLYTVYAAITMFWSVSMQLSGFRAFECMSMVLLMVTIVQNLLVRGGYTLTIRWVTMYVVVDVACALLRIVQMTTNVFVLLEASQMMSTVFFYLALYAKEKRWWHWLLIAMAIGSGSTVSYIGMALGTLSVFWTQSRYRVPVMIGAWLFAMFLIGYGPYRFLKDTVFYDKKEISITETSGRDHIMDAAIKSLEENPIGYGFDAGERYVMENKGFKGAIGGHNSFFSAAMGTGWVGVVLMALFFVSLAKITFSNHIPAYHRPTLIGCFCVMFVQCMGNPGLGSRIYGGWIAEMLVTALICGFYVAHKYYHLK